MSNTVRVQPKSTVKLGIDVLLEKRINLLEGKRVGLIINPTSVNGSLIPDVDLLYRNPKIKLVALFGPEHGVRGDVPAGQKIKDYVDKATGLPVYSLYGDRMKPTPEMLKNIDVLVYDIQDVGSRAYTYIYTMELAMEAAKEAGIKFIVLDRPNPVGGINVEGPLPENKDLRWPAYNILPISHGMTIGELALMFNKELNIGVDLTVVKMEGWQRHMLWDDTGLQWVLTSPHIPTPKAALCYPGTGLLGEIQNLSEGVGYTKPFEIIGAPWIDGKSLAKELNERQLPGVYFRPMYYRPFYFRYVGETCSGVEIHIIDEKVFKPVATSIHILAAIQKLYPGQLDFKNSPLFCWAVGDDKLVQQIESGKSAEAILSGWQKDVEKFKALRKSYLLYHE
ncbi:MAG TPA: DUF1343 domain-containing protein [bacterium (Candidatus Stahlbacteria)]|nr:DUF1343 domain-containing protein [Candidatus Stahlbacteria bacterium]